jgi:hypothetical protein
MTNEKTEVAQPAGENPPLQAPADATHPMAPADNARPVTEESTPHISMFRDQRILSQCEALGLPLLKAVQLAFITDSEDPYALPRVLDLDFSTYQPVQHRRPKRWLWMAAQTSSVSYHGILTEALLLDILLGGHVPDNFSAHIAHFLDEAPVSIVVMAVAEAAQRSNESIHEIWCNVAQLALRYSDHRRALWTNIQA